jgi:addiction module HigA family antidote
MKELVATETPRMAPTHPGEILREDVLPALGISVSEAARDLGITRQALHRVLAGTAAVTPEMAVRLGKFCGNGPGLWLRMQANYDLHRAEKRLASAVRRIPTRRATAAA